MNKVHSSPDVRCVPLLTFLMLSVAVAVALFPRCAPWLIYDRSAILSGQIWRMFTGHWVHFSTRHLVYDLIPLGLAGWIIESSGLPRSGWLCALTPWFISATQLLFEPQMKYCGGLSGLATAAIVYLALCGLSRPAPLRWVCAVTLFVVIGKTGFELATGQALSASLADTAAVVSVPSHLAGIAAAFLCYAAPNHLPAARLAFTAPPLGRG